MPRLPLVFAILCIASLVPFWAIHYQPLTDLANHLAAVSIWRNYADPHYDYARYYTLSLGLTPYWGYYALTGLLSLPFGVDIANRIVLSLYTVSFPVGMALLSRRFGRSPWLGLFAFPLIWNFNLVIGFVAFCVALAFLPFVLLMFDAFCDRPSWARGVLAAIMGATLFFCHLLPWGMYLGAAGLIGLLHRGRTGRRLAGRILVWSAALMAGLVVVLRGKGLHMGSFRGGLQVKYYPLSVYLREFNDWVLDLCQGHEGEILCLVLVGAWVALKVSATRQRLCWHDLRAEACFLTATVAYFALPRSILEPAYWWGVNLRFAVMSMAFAGLCIAGPIAGWRRWLLVPVALAGLGFAVDRTLHWQLMYRFFGQGFDALAPLPGPGKRVLFLIYPPWHDPSSKINYTQCAAGLYQAYYGGYQPHNFDDGFPLRYKVRYPAVDWRNPEFRWEKHAPYYDYVMTFQQEGRKLFAGHEREVTRVKDAGAWTLWKLPGPRVDVPPGPAYPSRWAGAW